jgi:uncharacterized protein (DUF488 family)
MIKTCSKVIFTVGHSNYEPDKFIRILKNHSIEMLIDVRSAPYSKYCPQFNKDVIEQILINNGLKYLFLGSELGARPKDENCYLSGKVSFEKLKDSEPFKKGILSVLEQSSDYKLALMCSEKEPINCHRAILISRVLEQQGHTVKHIIDENELLDHKELEAQLLRKFKIEKTLFDTDSSEQLNLQEAYQQQEKMISYQEAVEDSVI